MEIQWNDDHTLATISKDDLEILQGNFNKGYAKGTEKGRKEVAALLEPLGIDPENVEEGLKAHRQKIKELEEGKTKSKITETEAVKQLNEKIESLQEQFSKKSAAYDDLQKEGNRFKDEMLIERELLSLAGNETHQAVNPKQAMLLFRQDYGVEIGEDNKLVIKNGNGNTMFNEHGDELTLPEIFKKFSADNGHLFKAGGSRGGSGGGPGDGKGPAGVKYSDLKGDAEKTKYVQDHGLDAYNKLVQNHAADMNNSK
jgi:hypothetical protein